MKIVSFKTRTVKVPRDPGPNVGGATSAPFVTLTVKTDEGVEGISYAGFINEVMLKALNDCVRFSRCRLFRRRLMSSLSTT